MTDRPVRVTSIAYGSRWRVGYENPDYVQLP